MNLFARSWLPAIAAFAMAIAVASTLSSLAHAQNTQNPPGQVGRLALIDGTVSFHTADQNTWQAARRNYPVTTGQSFWTEPNAHAAIDVASNRIYLDSSTQLDISLLDDTATQFSLPQGAVFVALRASEESKPYEVQMARGAVTLAAAGRYEVIAGDTEHASQVTVFDGSAHVSGNGFDLDVRAGEATVISGEPIRADVRAAGPADAFVAWVEAQEQRHRRNAPTVASAMTGAAELGAYGRWTRAERYGEVWYPDVPAGWAPYREGYWAWVEPWGFTWIDDEAWGFAPFHYGRWLMIDDRWAWIPGGEATEAPMVAIYAPALVTFFTAADLCGWVPLGPDEVYVPPYPVALPYFQSINAFYVRDIRSRNRIFTDRTTVKAYANARALTVVPRSVVSGSQPVAAHARAASAASLADAHAVMGASPVRPTAATAGLSPSVAQHFGIAAAALAAAHAQAHAPGPPIHAVAPTPNARIAAPHAPAPAAQHTAVPSAAPGQRQAPALAQPGVTHHLPGSPVGQTGATGGNRSTQGAPPASTATNPTPPAVARMPEAPGAHAAPSPETAGRTAPQTAPSRPALPPAAVHGAPQPPTQHAAPPSATTGRAPPPHVAAPAHPAPPPAVHSGPPPVAHVPPPVVHRSAPPPATIGRAPPPHVAAPARPTPPPVVHAPPPVVHAAPPATVGRAPPAPALRAPPAAAAPGRRPGH